jgi:hypothetical protein
MGRLLSSFNYPRNAFASSALESADKTHETIERARSKQLRDKDEPFNDAKTFLGVVTGTKAAPGVTKLGEAFETHYQANRTDAWRWLITRAMWRFSVPNGTQQEVTKAATELGVSFNFFDMIVRTIWMLAVEPYPGDSLYFDELFAILDDDGAWALTGTELAVAVLNSRRDGVDPPAGHRSLLGDLEEEFCGRDNMNTVFRKALGQSGLVDLTKNGATLVGVRLSDQVPRNEVLWRRLRFALDHPMLWTASADGAHQVNPVVGPETQTATQQDLPSGGEL